MDEIAPMAQAMSIAHHQEVVNDHMNDSNWCKIIRIGKCLLSVPSDLTVVPRRFIMREMEASTRGCFHDRSSI
jgi:hypothetical protein